MTTPATASAANNKSGSRPPLRLAARYYWLLLFVILPLFIIVVLLATLQYRDQRAQLLQDLAQRHATYTIALEAIVKAASNHVLQMKSWSEHYLKNPPEQPSALRRYFTPHRVDGVLDTYTLDAVPEHLRPFIGQLFWLHGDPRDSEMGRVVLDHALDFFSLVRLTHEVTHYFQWSYYFPANQTFFNMYPWQSTSDVLDHLGTSSMRKSIQMLYAYDFYLSATPQKNPQRKPYWTAPYVDAAGTSTMVTHGAPVYVDDEFRGLVGTDVRLNTLEQFLLDLPLNVGRLLILDDGGLVLADSEGSPQDVIRKAAEVVPAVFVARKQGFVPLNAENPQTVNGYSVMALNTVHAPWTLAYLIRDQEIDGLLSPHLLPYRVILIVLGVTVFLALYLLRREFISPALALVHFIRDASRDPAVEAPQLPPLWQTWANAVSHAFVANRETTRKLRESEKRLQQILNNSSKVIYVRDLDGRFLLINKAFERLFGITQKELKGKRMEAVFPSHTANEFQTNDLRVIEQNSVMEFEEQVALEDGMHTYLSIKYPLYDSEGSIYAIAGVSTDISKRKQSEEALRQAALGISKARGAELFNILVVHLSKAIGSDYAFIGILEKANQIRTRALYAHGRIEANISYSLEGTACANVVGQQFRFYPDGIQRRFPSSLLREIDMHSYAAIPLFDSAGKALGVLGVLHGQPLQDEHLIESILKIFAGRAAGELERERADAALRASEASYRAIFEASEDAIFVHDMDTGAILDVNRKACKAYGYSKAEIRKVDLGMLSSGVPPYTREEAEKLMGRAIVGERLRFAWHRKNRDGSLHWDEVFLRRASIGGHDRILAFNREITARKEAEEKLRASETQYRKANRRLRESETFMSAIVENALLGIAVGNAEGIVEFNPAAVEMFGYAKHEAMGHNLAELIIPPAHRKAHVEGLAYYLRTGESVLGKRLECSALRADGSEFPAEISMSVNRVGDTNYFTAFIADLTEKQAAEDALRASEEQYRSIFNATSDALILWDARGKIVDVNPAAWRMGGYTKEEFLNKPFHEHIHPSSIDAYNKFKSQVAVAKAATTEIRAIRKDGTLIDLESRSIPMPYQGQPHILTITRDITEQKRVAVELARQREALRQSEKMSAMGELLAGVAHELNNPLAILMGRTALLENKTNDPVIQAEVEKIHSAAGRCGRIVRTFLSMARQKPPQRQPANLNEVVMGALNLLGYGLHTSGIALKTRLAKDLPKQYMDIDQVGQVVINLLVNAQHVLTEQPEPRRIEVETGKTNGSTYFRLTDNGPGVPDAFRARIFDPFFTTKEGNLGTGIGLSVSRSIAREHGGTLCLDNSQQGAVFVLSLPLDSVGDTNAPDDSQLVKEETHGSHVLIVEDEPDVADLLVDILQSAEFKTTWASSGLKALEWLQHHSCDLILSDIRMPDMDGPGLWRALKQQHPVLLQHTAFITGDTLSAGVAPFLKETEAPLLEKPFTPEQVLTLVARLEPD
jgi:PAS domain S-box-containing protein